MAAEIISSEMQKQLYDTFDSVIADCGSIREILKSNDITTDQLRVLQARLSANKVINGACNGKLTTARLLGGVGNTEEKK